MNHRESFGDVCLFVSEEHWQTFPPIAMIHHEPFRRFKRIFVLQLTNDAHSGFKCAIENVMFAYRGEKSMDFHGASRY